MSMEWFNSKCSMERKIPNLGQILPHVTTIGFRRNEYVAITHDERSSAYNELISDSES